jgi:hypothetical protein
MYWAPVEDGYGTFVAMRIEDGLWVQEHRPTGTIVRVVPPFDIELEGSAWEGANEIFDPRASLDRTSPGVIPQPFVVTQALLYKPGPVPIEVRPSWGDELLAELTWPEAET